MSTIVFPRRYRGPLTSVNGGYAAGALAAHVDPSGGAVEVTLRLPPPLDTELEVDGGRLMHGDALVAEATGTELEVADVPAVTADEAAEATRRHNRVGSPDFAECFSCGVRADGSNLAIHPGRVADRDVMAAPWVATEVDVPVVWSAIDCTGAYAVADAGRGEAVLGRMAARILRLPQDGEPCVVVGWSLGTEGRKRFAATALLGADGAPVAVARQTWITPRV